jgi:hypothetical protein
MRFFKVINKADGSNSVTINYIILTKGIIIMRVITLAILILAVISGSASAEPSAIAFGVEPTFNGDGRLIAYTGMDGGSRDIFVIDDGGRKRRLTSDIYWDGQPAFSSESDSVVFVSDRSGVRELWRVSLDGSSPEQLTFGDSWKSNPSVGPMGAIVYVSGRYPKQDIYLLEAGMVRKITTLEDEVSSPVWNPDGDKIAFVKGEDLMTINRDGTELQKIATGVYSRGLSWGRDGRILYLTRDVGYDLWSIDLAGSGEKELIYEGVTDSWEVNPAISSQGEIAFSTDKDGFYKIYVMKIEISGVQIELPTPASAPEPVYEPALTPQDYPVEAPFPASLPAQQPTDEIVEERTPENTREELENAQDSELKIPDPSSVKDEIKLPDSQLSEELVIHEPTMPESGEIEIPDRQLSEEGEIRIDDEHISLWLIATFALLVLLIERQKSKRPKYTL